MILPFGLALVPLLLTSCANRNGGTLVREDLFSLSIGKMEDQIDLFQLAGIPVSHKTRIVMRDGFLYVANGNACKVMQFNSYGDLLSMYYNAEANPKPVMLQTSDSTGPAANRRAFAYPFRQVGEVAVNSRKDLYVEERLQESRRKFDGQLGAVLDRIVVMFSRTGEMLGYLGQEGAGGSPFPYIERLAVTDTDDVVVVTRAAKAWIVFWFDPAGTLVSRLEVPLERLPIPETAGVIPALDTIHPAPDRRALYLKLSYYVEAIDEATRKMYRVENLPSRIYTLDVETGKYEGWVEVPRNLRREEGIGMFERLEVEYGYEFIGAASGGFLYFISPSDSNLYELLVLHESGRVTARRTIVVEDSELVYKTLSVSADGIVSALLGKTYGAEIVWWRSDRLIRRD